MCRRITVITECVRFIDENVSGRRALTRDHSDHCYWASGKRARGLAHTHRRSPLSDSVSRGLTLTSQPSHGHHSHNNDNESHPTPHTARLKLECAETYGAKAVFTELPCRAPEAAPRLAPRPRSLRCTESVVVAPLSVLRALGRITKDLGRGRRETALLPLLPVAQARIRLQVPTTPTHTHRCDHDDDLAHHRSGRAYLPRPTTRLSGFRRLGFECETLI